MRLPLALVVLLIALLSGSLALAQEDDEEEDEPHPFTTWAIDMGNRSSVGLNGILTSPADPVMFALDGQDVFEKLPGSTYTGPVVGFLAGTCQMPYRILMGSFDLAFSWMPFLYMQSPVPRFKLLPWALHDDE